MVDYTPQQFLGEGMQTGEFSGVERAQLRDQFQSLDKTFVPLDKYEIAGMRLLGTVRRAWYLFPLAFGLGGAPKLWNILQVWLYSFQSAGLG